MTAPASPLSCLLCGSTDAPPFLDVPEGRFSSRIGAFSVLRCSACGLARMTPFPDADDLAELYVEQGVFSAQRPNPNQGKVGFSTLEPLYSRYGAYYHFTARSCVRSWRSGKRKGPPRILDVGCSTGRLLEAFEGVAPEAELHGIDLDPRARERAPARLQPRIRTVAIEDLVDEEPFDIITLSFIIEHLLDFGPRCDRPSSCSRPAVSCSCRHPISAPQRPVSRARGGDSSTTPRDRSDTSGGSTRMRCDASPTPSD